MKRKTIVVLAFVSVGVGLLISSSQAKPVAPPLKVGVLLSSSGPLYFAGAFQKAATELVAGDNPGKVSFIYQDAGDSDYEARSALTFLKAQGANLVLTPIDSESAKRVVRMNQDQPLPLIAPSSLVEGVGGNYQGKNYLFRLATTASQDAAMLAQYIKDDGLDSVGIVTSGDAYARAMTRLLAFDLSMLGVKVGITPMVDFVAFRKTNFEVTVLIGLEQTLDFLDSNSAFLAREVYFVSGNLANYSAYPWAEDLAGAKALIPSDGVTQGFRVRLATLMNRPNLLATPNSPMFGLARRTYDSVVLALEAWKDPDNFRFRLAQSKSGGRLLFSSEGFYKGQKYSLYRYSESGIFTRVDQDIP